MIRDSLYGPQFDPSDGTIGELQLVKRWVIVHTVDGYDRLWYPRQGRHTFARRPVKLLKSIWKVNRPEHLEGAPRIVQWWCYPGHFDPAYPVTE